jgi:peptidoglycan-associated lipoprotein
MRRVWIATVFIAVLAGCASTPEEQEGAGVEDRSAKPPTVGAQTQPIKQPPVTGVDLTTKPGGRSILTDPSSPLSKRSIYFDFDRYDVKEEFRPLVELHARYLRDNKQMKMLIQGNTDEPGSREYNLALGQKRS